MITNQDWWPDQLNLKVLLILISVMAAAISISSPLFGKSVGDTPSVSPERGTVQNGQNNAKGEAFAYLGLADPRGRVPEPCGLGLWSRVRRLAVPGRIQTLGPARRGNLCRVRSRVQILQILRIPHLHGCQNHLLHIFRRIGAAILPGEWADQAIPLWDYRLLRLPHQDGGRRRLPFHRYR